MVLKHTIVLTTGVMTVGFLLSEFFPHAIASVFTSNQQLIELVVPGLRIVFIFFPIVGFQMVTSNFFQSIGMPQKAIFMSLSRQVLFLIPCLLILPQLFGVKGVWYSLPTADFLSSIIAAYMLTTIYKKPKITP
jgi:Na+-driven multidrug efflux pump